MSSLALTFVPPSFISSGFTSFANASFLPSSNFLSSSCVQAASDANVYTTETFAFEVGTETITNTNTNIVSWASFVPPEECCQPDLCEVTASRVGIIYWPPNAAGTNQSFARSGDSVQTVVSDGFTFTSPSIYVAYTDLQASKSCFTGSRQAGGIYRHTTIAYEPDTLSVGCGLAGPWYPLNITRLFDPPTNGEMYLSEACAPIYASNQAQWLSFEAGHGQAASPQFSMPVGLKSIDPAWSACKPFPLGVWDPPRTLSAVSAMDPTTKHIATTTPVASPGVSPTPLITPTASHVDPKATGNDDPKNTADPKETANPATSKAEDGLKHSAASQADPAIAQSLGLRPSRTQDPDSHSEQVDPDPGATSRTPHISKVTADNPGGIPIVIPSSTEDPQHLTTADQQVPSGKNTVSAVPVELPVFDPMTLIDPHHRSSHRTSTVDPASKTQIAHTMSVTNSAVDAHDTGVGNAIDPAIMSKVIGIDNVFGGAARGSSTALGGEADPASKTHAAHTKGTTNLAAKAHNTGAANAINPGIMSKVIGIDNIFGGAAGDSSTVLGGAADTTGIGSQVVLASTQHKFSGSGSEFDAQETARPYTAATIVAQSSEPNESAGKAGSYPSLDSGFATTTQDTQSTRGFSASSSAIGASTSDFDGPSSLADGSPNGSRAKSETLRSRKTGNSMSTSNSHEDVVSHQTRTSGTVMASAVANGPQSTDLANSATLETARLTSSASTTDITGSTAITPASFLGQGTRLLPNSTVSAFMWLVASALCIYPWAS